MIAEILNRPWRVSRKQAGAILRDGLSRRKVLVGGAMVSLGAVLSACGIDISMIGQTVAGDVQSIATALLTGLAGLNNLPGILPVGWPDTLAQISAWVTDIKAIAASITAATLVSTAGGNIANLIHDFNQIVQAIVSNPVIATLVSGTGFGWALYAAPVLLALIEQAVNLVLSIAQPPAPTPIPTPAPASRMRARLAAPLTPELAREILAEVIATGGH